MPAAKRAELLTYRELSLGRELKNARRRRKLQANGVQRVLGDSSLSRPYLPVPTARYREVRQQMQTRMLREARASGIQLPLEQILEHLRPRIEALTYAQLAREGDDSARCQMPVAGLEREPTPQEKARFEASLAAGTDVPPGGRRASAVALDHVLGRVEKRQVHNPARHQAAWARLVGPDIAAQTRLERVDAPTQTAYFRCLNSTLSADLQRRADLPAKLSRILGAPVRRLRSQF